MADATLDMRPHERAMVEAILARHVPDREVWVFGSRANDKARTFSDLDLAVMGDTPLDLATGAALAEAFSESDLPWRVDVVDWATTSEAFRRIIERNHVVLRSQQAVSGFHGRVRTG